MSLPLRAHATTHPGLLHPRNEDSHRVIPTEEGGLLLVVCDGMGGMGRGDEASRIAIEVICEAMARGDGLPPDRMRHALRLADQRVRDELCGSGGQLPGSTAVMVYVLDGAAHVAWVGDSRAYLVRDAKLIDRTRDHKLVEELVDAGQITAEQAKTSALAHVVTRALGGRPPDDAVVNAATLGYPWKLLNGDRILVCSDGVCDLVDDAEVAAMLGQGTVEAVVQKLVDTALERGGHDNITCIVGSWEGPSWVEEDQATPVMRASRDHLPDARGWSDKTDPSMAPVPGVPPLIPTESEITWDGTEGSPGRVTEEIDLSSMTPSQEGEVRAIAPVDARPPAVPPVIDARPPAVPPAIDARPPAVPPAIDARPPAVPPAIDARPPAVPQGTTSPPAPVRATDARQEPPPAPPVEPPLEPAPLPVAAPPVDTSPGGWMIAGGLLLVLAVAAAAVAMS